MILQMTVEAAHEEAEERLKEQAYDHGIFGA